MATIDTASAAIRRARKRFAHAIRQLECAESEGARKRHARRAMNAQRGLSEATREFQTLALQDA